MQPYLQERLRKLQERLSPSGVDGVLVTNLTNIYYLTGFSGTAATVYISDNRRLFFTDARYTLIAKKVVTDFDIIETRIPLEKLKEILKEDKVHRLGFDNQISFAYYQDLQAQFVGVDLIAQNNLIEELRMIKDDLEIQTIRKACAISDKAFTDVLSFIKPGQTTELEVANFLDFQMRQYGASGISFDTIAASGERSSMPHGRASNKVIENGETLTLDFGCYYDHYVSDMTRTIHVGHVTDEEREIYDIVLRANEALIKEVKAGVSYRDFDAIPRRVINEAGYGTYFTHGIGHGIGLDVHEIPYFGKSDDPVKAGMVLTDEPGIYLEGKYGVRIEDDLVITETGCEILTLAPKELIVI